MACVYARVHPAPLAVSERQCRRGGCGGGPGGTVAAAGGGTAAATGDARDFGRISQPRTDAHDGGVGNTYYSDEEREPVKKPYHN
jgi:hypothetical protein